MHHFLYIDLSSVLLFLRTYSCYTCPKVLGKFVTRKANTNNNPLLSTCIKHLLFLTNTCFKHKQIIKNSWMHLRPKHWHLINYLITWLHDLLHFQITWAINGANCSCQTLQEYTPLNIISLYKKKEPVYAYVVIKSTTKIWTRRKIRKDKMQVRKLTTNTIKINRVRDELLVSLNDRLAKIPAGTVEENWNAFTSIV